jgi:hypothetical protein
MQSFLKNISPKVCSSELIETIFAPAFEKKQWIGSSVG